MSVRHNLRNNNNNNYTDDLFINFIKNSEYRRYTPFVPVVALRLRRGLVVEDLDGLGSRESSNLSVCNNLRSREKGDIHISIDSWLSQQLICPASRRFPF